MVMKSDYTNGGGGDDEGQDAQEDGRATIVPRGDPTDQGHPLYYRILAYGVEAE